MDANSRVKIFAGSATLDLAKKIAKDSGTVMGAIDLKKFSDGEFLPRYEGSVRGLDVFIVQSTTAPADNLLELLLLIDAAKRASAHSITAVMPYFGFARQDRKDKPRVPISAKLIANMIETAGAKRVITMDLHAPQIQGFFNIPVDNLEASALFVPYLEDRDISDLTFATPDSGGADRVRAYAEYFGARMVICDKFRKKPNEIEDIIVIGDVEGQNVVILDDMSDTAGTLCKVAEKLMKKGAKSVRALCTHPVLSGNAFENIEASPLLEVVVTDTIPLKQESKKIHVLSASKLFATAIERVYTNGSVNDLFVFSKNSRKQHS